MGERTMEILVGVSEPGPDLRRIDRSLTEPVNGMRIYRYNLSTLERFLCLSSYNKLIIRVALYELKWRCEGQMYQRLQSTNAGFIHSLMPRLDDFGSIRCSRIESDDIGMVYASIEIIRLRGTFTMTMVVAMVMIVVLVMFVSAIAHVFDLDRCGCKRSKKTKSSVVRTLLSCED